MIFGTGIDIGLALLLAAIFVKYTGIKLATKPLNLLASGAVLFILAGVLSGLNLGYAMPATVDVTLNNIGAIAAVVGVLWSVYLLVIGKK